jgi:hypothetical protein
LLLTRFVCSGGCEKQTKRDGKKGYEFNAQKNKKNSGTIGKRGKLKGLCYTIMIEIWESYG